MIKVVLREDDFEIEGMPKPQDVSEISVSLKPRCKPVIVMHFYADEVVIEDAEVKELKE